VRDFQIPYQRSRKARRQPLHYFSGGVRAPAWRLPLVAAPLTLEAKSRPSTQYQDCWCGDFLQQWVSGSWGGRCYARYVAPGFFCCWQARLVKRCRAAARAGEGQAGALRRGIVWGGTRCRRSVVFLQRMAARLRGQPMLTQCRRARAATPKLRASSMHAEDCRPGDTLLREQA
jgi:hypothetical protein